MSFPLLYFCFPPDLAIPSQSEASFKTLEKLPSFDSSLELNKQINKQNKNQTKLKKLKQKKTPHFYCPICVFLFLFNYLFVRIYLCLYFEGVKFLLYWDFSLAPLSIFKTWVYFHFKGLTTCVLIYMYINIYIYLYITYKNMCMNISYAYICSHKSDRGDCF